MVTNSCTIKVYLQTLFSPATHVLRQVSSSTEIHFLNLNFYKIYRTRINNNKKKSKKYPLTWYRTEGNSASVHAEVVAGNFVPQHIAATEVFRSDESGGSLPAENISLASGHGKEAVACASCARRGT